MRTLELECARITLHITMHLQVEEGETFDPYLDCGNVCGELQKSMKHAWLLASWAWPDYRGRSNAVVGPRPAH